LVAQYGKKKTYAAELTCPACHKTRWYPLFHLRQNLKRGSSFTGRCRNCALEPTRFGYWEWARKNRVYRRSINHAGYVTLGPTSASDKELPMFRAMQNNAYVVFEHRWVMAKHLGRALKSWECIDHMDGDKTNNAIENRRIYIRGKNQPGSGNGHSTYYHEWQMAERRVKELEVQLARKRKLTASTT